MYIFIIVTILKSRILFANEFDSCVCLSITANCVLVLVDFHCNKGKNCSDLLSDNIKVVFLS